MPTSSARARFETAGRSSPKRRTAWPRPRFAPPGRSAAISPTQRPPPLCGGAEGRLAGPARERVVPLARFFRGFYGAALEPGEIVTAVRIPPAPAGARGGYVKYTSRSAEDKPLVGVAALVALDAVGRCREARIADGGAAAAPHRPARGPRG